MVLQELEGFTYATALDLNMGYYTIRLDPDASRICTIFFLWGKYSYKRLPIGIAGSPDIFQSKMLELMIALEFVQTYLDDLLLISKRSLKDHLENLRLVLTKLRSAGLKINAAKSTFCSLETEYLGYALTRKGIAPQTKDRLGNHIITSSKSKGVVHLPRNGAILPRYVEKPKRDALFII